MRNIGLALLATALVVAMSYFAQPAPTAAPTAPPTAIGGATPQLAVAQQSSTAGVPAELDRLIKVFERRTTDSDDALDFRTLGGHYSARAAITGDLADYAAAATAYATAYDLAPTDRDGRVGYAGAVAAIHQFGTALQVAEEALADNEDDVDALALAGDAAAELGNLKLASSYYGRLDLLAPDHPAVLARLAGFAHLQGEQAKAVALARLADETAQQSSPRSRSAFYPLLLSDLLLDAGQYDQAVASATDAVGLEPGAGVTHAGYGRALSHAGRFAEAIESYETALTIQDDAGWRVALAGLLTATGRADAAAIHYRAALDQLESQDEAIGGQSLASLYADLNIESPAALAIAEREIARRQSIDAYDTLAWALYRNGDLESARSAIDTARSTGAQDATLIYHSGVIAAAQGDTGHAIVELTELLDRNPGFDPVFSRHAFELLASLTG